MASKDIVIHHIGQSECHCLATQMRPWRAWTLQRPEISELGDIVQSCREDRHFLDEI